VTYPWNGYISKNKGEYGIHSNKDFKRIAGRLVRIPKEIAYPESVSEIESTAIGNKRILLPAGQSWDDWFESEGVSEDFMSDRKQPEDQFRDNL
jgi:antitoxin VapB